MDAHVLYVIEHITSKQKYPPACLSVCMRVCASHPETQDFLKELADPNKIWSSIYI